LNIDMIGRMDKKHENNPDYVYIIGSSMLSKDLHLVSEEANKAFSIICIDENKKYSSYFLHEDDGGYVMSFSSFDSVEEAGEKVKDYINGMIKTLKSTMPVIDDYFEPAWEQDETLLSKLDKDVEMFAYIFEYMDNIMFEGVIEEVDNMVKRIVASR